ncbi:hypothetical protein F7Q99_38280 [Streptomyces kaniharaensis]|uniref:Uncharacterized protein n=1 Tax=Streptomyces kaniharaensis TaxID=212423 RepID=A0A6N7L6Q4_9ACTN|nr:hypothetical protein [Streptomyces kaniharaensis]MQS17883.1 hypothetical protein [Streptomyces kaniharaensis]
MHHFVTLSGVAAVLLAVWAVQLTVLALHLRYAIHHGVRTSFTNSSEEALQIACFVATLVSAIGGGVAFGAGLHATAWGWAQVILAIGTSVSYQLLVYATGWDMKTWWHKRKTGKAGGTEGVVETA